MNIWQVDFYRRPQPDTSGKFVWQLLICNSTRSFEYEANCLQSEANSSWLASMLVLASEERLPDLIQVFRPQSLSIVTQAGRNLGINVEPTRRTLALKQWLKEKQYSLDLEKSPPIPLPENLWGKEWRFVTTAGDVVEAFGSRPIPILSMPEFLLPLNLGLASTVPIPGVVIYGGRKSMRLARWLKEVRPVAVDYMTGAPDGLVLEAGLADRFVVVTFTDPDVIAAAKLYQQRKQLSKGLHFLLVQPDDSEMTYSGFWLLAAE